MFVVCKIYGCLRVVCKIYGCLRDFYFLYEL